MIVLALEGGLGAFSAAVVRDGLPLAVRQIAGGLALEQGLETVSSVLAQAGTAPSDIDRLSVGIGPGGFTGVRIAISYAKSLAQGWKRPLCGVNSFDAIEWGVPASPAPLLAVVRGRTGVVSVRYRREGREDRYSGYVRDVVAQLEEPAGAHVRVVGDTQDVLGALAERGWGVEPVTRSPYPAAVAVAVLAGEREAARSFHELRADYGELPAARVPSFGGAHGKTAN